MVSILTFLAHFVNECKIALPTTVDHLFKCTRRMLKYLSLVSFSIAWVSIGYFTHEEELNEPSKGRRTSPSSEATMSSWAGRIMTKTIDSIVNPIVEAVEALSTSGKRGTPIPTRTSSERCPTRLSKRDNGWLPRQ